MEYGNIFLNKVITENKVTEISRHNIRRDDMPSEVDKNIYDFIIKYSEENEGNAPSYATVAAEVEGFEYIPEVTDGYDYLANQIKEYSMLTEVLGWFQKKGGDKKSKFEVALNEMGAKKFLKTWLPEQTERINHEHSSMDKIGTNVKRDGKEYLEEYYKRKSGESFKIWKSNYDCIGEYISSNLYTVYGKSGRGKSIITLEEGVYAAEQGANVLIWALEMGMFEVLTRVYVSISGNVGSNQELINGVNMSVGFNSTDVRRGSLNEEFEEAFEAFVLGMNEILKGNITVKAVDDIGFTDRSVRAIQSDIHATDADFVIIDPFYYLHYEANTSRTTGGDATSTSERLRIMAGTTETVVIAITQAEESDQGEDEDGNREMELPKRSEVMKTQALMQDAYLLIAVDTDYKQGRGLIGVNKGRDGGEGNVTDIMFLPNYGVVKAMETGEEVANEFDF